MKQIPITIIVATLLLFVMSCSKKSAQKNPGRPLSVKTVLASPKSYLNKKITVIGNIYKQEKEKSKVQLVDLTECTSSCNPVHCKVITLPVYYGELSIPAVGTNVRVSGKITRKEGKFTFSATKVEPHNEE